MNIKSIKSANGVKCCLLHTGENYIIRVYNYETVEGGINTIKGYKDYDILHCDLQFVIDDEDAYFYEMENGKLYLDHSPKTVGLVYE